jgi:hypothetical protein
MDTLRRQHSRPMIQRIQRVVLGLAFSSCVLACLGKTTSLGGPPAEQASASSKDAGADASASAAANDDSQGVFTSAPGSGSPAGPMCSWYVWNPVPTTVACEYLLPTDPPDNEPSFDPKTWDPHNVRVEFGAKNTGPYAATSADCGSTDGWFYVDPANGQPPTRFMLCPQTCASVQGDGGDGYLGLAASSCRQ